MHAASTADARIWGAVTALLHVVTGQQPVELKHAFGQRPTLLPERAERGGQAQSLAEARTIVPGLEVGELQGGPDIRISRLELIEELGLARPVQAAPAADATVRKYARCRCRTASSSPLSASRASEYSCTVCSIRNAGTSPAVTSSRLCSPRSAS